MSIEVSSTDTLPFGSLYLSPFNVRKETDDPELPELIASIKAHGVLDNLVVHPEHPTSKKSRKVKHPRYGVVSGGRRWRALTALREQGLFDDDDPVACKICSYEDAIEISLAANMFRTMHPADQFVAFKELIDAGRSVEEVAVRFGVTPLVIHRRLRLANLRPMFLPLYRAGRGVLGSPDGACRHRRSRTLASSLGSVRRREFIARRVAPCAHRGGNLQRVTDCKIRRR